MARVKTATRPAVQEPPEPALPPEALDRIERALRQLRRAVRLIDMREQCGEDCQELRSLVAHFDERLETLRKVYFPRGKS